MDNGPDKFLFNHKATLAALPDLLLPWYAANKRDLPWRHTHEAYRIFVSEIMLQQTRVAAVIGYYERFMQLFPTVHDLAQADDEVLMKAWEGLGYYSRARNLKKAAQEVCTRFDGNFPADFYALTTLSGIGDYTAGAIASIAFNRRVAAVDGNVLRILARVLEKKDPADEKYKTALHNALSSVYPTDGCGDFTQSFMDLGSAVCLPKQPLCTLCPLRSVCLGYQHGTADTLPARKQKTARRQESRTVWVLRKDGRVAVRKRGDSGLLAGLWELPNVLGFLSEQEAVTAAQQQGAKVLGAFTVRHAKHIFTHIEWDMLIYDAEIDCPDDAFIFADPHEKSGKALPTAFKKCIL